MSGVTPLVDTLLATRLAQRVDLVPLKAAVQIAEPAAVTGVEPISNDVRLPSRAALQQQLGLGMSYQGEGAQAAPAASSGGAVTLSAAARAVSAVLELPGSVDTKVRGSEPLWPHAQRPPAAPLLAGSLSRTVASSGLFYESHLRQFAAGTRSLAQLLLEPQAGLAATAKMLSGPVATPAPPVAPATAAGPDTPPIPTNSAPPRVGPDLAALAPARAAAATGVSVAQEPALAGLLLAAGDADGDAELLPQAQARQAPVAAAQAGTPPAGQAGSPAPLLQALAFPAAAGVTLAHPDPAQLAASYAGAGPPGSTHTPFHQMVGQLPGAEALVADPQDAALRRDPVAAAIHPEAVSLVRQQLELLASPVFRWAGEAWPGTPVEWDIHEEAGDEARDEGDHPEAAVTTWATRLSLNLPRLGAVEVRLRVAGETLQLQLAAAENATVALLGQGGGALPQRFEALGLALTGLQIGALAAGKDGHAA